MDSKREIVFNGWRQLAYWLLNTKGGERFMNWFIRKHHKELMTTDFGARFHNWVVDKVTTDTEEAQGVLLKTKIVIIETFPDGYIKVYGNSGIRVKFINRISVRTNDAEILDEERVSLEMKPYERDLYESRAIGSDHIALHPRDICELLAIESKKRISGFLSTMKQVKT